MNSQPNTDSNPSTSNTSTILPQGLFRPQPPPKRGTFPTRPSPPQLFRRQSVEVSSTLSLTRSSRYLSEAPLHGVPIGFALRRPRCHWPPASLTVVSTTFSCR